MYSHALAQPGDYSLTVPLRIPVTACHRGAACRGASNHGTCMQTLHVGDRFTASGNDAATRDCCAILWVAAPEETCFFVDMLLDDIQELRESPYIE